MSLSSLSNYRNLLLSTHCYKNENITRFFGYIGTGGKTLNAKEVSTFQDTFVHPQGVLARSAMLRDVGNGDLKYGNAGIEFYSYVVGNGSANAVTTSAFTKSGRIVGLFVDEVKGGGAGGSLQVQSRIADANAIGATRLTTLSDILPAATGILTGNPQDLTGLLTNYAPYNHTLAVTTVAGTNTASTAWTTAADGKVTVATADTFGFAAGDNIYGTIGGTGTWAAFVATSGLYVGAIDRSGSSTTFYMYTTQAAALAATTSSIGSPSTPSAATVTIATVIPIASYNAGFTSTALLPAVTTTYSSETQSDGSVRSVPAKITITNPGSGYSNVSAAASPTFTWTSASGSTVAPIHRVNLANGRLNSVDLLHTLDILPGGALKFIHVGGSAASASVSTIRVTVAVAHFST